MRMRNTTQVKEALKVTFGSVQETHFQGGSMVL